MKFNTANTTDLLETVLNRTKGRYLSEEDARLVELLMCCRENGKTAMDDKEHEYRTTTHEEQQEWLRTVRKTEY